MKFVYVLINNPFLYYDVQCYLSIWTLRFHNPGAYIILATDQKNSSLSDLSPLLTNNINEIKVVNVPNELSYKSRSRFIKTSLRKNIEGDFLYIDSDTLITDNLDNLNEIRGDLGAVLDCNVAGSVSDYMGEKLLSIGVTINQIPNIFNGGVLLVKDSPLAHKFFEDWHNLWLKLNQEKGIEIDQVAFVLSIIQNKNILKELPGIYNCQLPFKNSHRYLIDAKIIHYISDFNTDMSFPLKDHGLLKNIKINGITDEIKDILINPKEAFLEHNLIVDAAEKELYYRPMMILGRKLSRDYPWTNNIAKAIYRLFGYKI